MRLQAQSLSASLYPGYRVPVNVLWMSLEEFEKQRRLINDMAARAMDHGIMLSNRSTDYGTRSRRASTTQHVRSAQRHLGFFLNRRREGEPNDRAVGVQAFLAMQDALKAVVYAQEEWCPDIEDIDMLIALDTKADPGFKFYPSIEGEVYSQYNHPREGLPVERPMSGIPGYVLLVEGDVHSVLGRVDVVREPWNRNGSASSA